MQIVLTRSSVSPTPTPGYAFISVKQPGGAYVQLRAKKSDGTYVTLQGKVS